MTLVTVIVVTAVEKLLVVYHTSINIQGGYREAASVLIINAKQTGF